MSFGLRNKGTKDAGVNDSGRIKGAGTGTSDDVKKEVPSGSYIMPADSTAQIGEQSLQRLGKPTPVNLSNGEFQLTPDQVHQVGVHALNQMKNQTHVPVNQPQVQENEKGEPEFFFADGGDTSPLPEYLKRRNSNPMVSNGMNSALSHGFSAGINQNQGASEPAQQQKTGGVLGTSGAWSKRNMDLNNDDGTFNPLSGGVNIARGLGKAVAGTLGGLAAGGAEGVRSVGAWIGGGDNRDAGNMVAPSFDFAGEGLSDARRGVRQLFGQAPKVEAAAQMNAPQPAPASAKASASQVQRLNTTVAQPASAVHASAVSKSTVPAAAGLQPTIQDRMNVAMYGGAQSASEQTVQPPAQNDNPYAIQQKGSSFSYANPAAATQARANGVPELQSSNAAGGIRRANDPRGVASMIQNTAEFGPADQHVSQALNAMNSTQNIQYPNRPQRSQEQDIEREQVMSDIRAPIEGARGMTSSQRSQLMEMQTGDDNRAVQMYNTDANNATSQFNNNANNSANMAQTIVREQGASQRAVLGENGQNFRQGQSLNQDSAKFNAEYGLKNRQQNLTEQKEGFGIRQAQRVEKLQEMYDKAQTDEERKGITERRNRLMGGDGSKKNPYMTVGGGQIYDKDAGLINQPQRLFNYETGQFIDATSQQQSPQIPQPGQVINGFRFKGGDFNNQSSWEKI